MRMGLSTEEVNNDNNVKDTDIDKDTKLMDEIVKETKLNDEVAENTKLTDEVIKDKKLNDEDAENTKLTDEVAKDAKLSDEVAKDAKLSDEVAKDAKLSDEVAKDAKLSNEELNTSVCKIVIASPSPVFDNNDSEGGTDIGMSSGRKINTSQSSYSAETEEGNSNNGNHLSESGTNTDENPSTSLNTGLDEESRPRLKCIKETQSLDPVYKPEGEFSASNKPKTAKPKRIGNFALAIQKKFNSLSLGRSVHVTGASIRNTQIDIDSKESKVTNSDIIIGSFQLGIAYTVGKLTAKPDRDVLLSDFAESEEFYFPSAGSSWTPSHKLPDFTMVDYSPVAFKYFRDIFAISASDFMMSLSIKKLVSLSNAGASGSLFFLSDDDTFIIKTVDKRESHFLQQLLPGYYMNLNQNPKTFLPKFFGMYSFKTIGKYFRVIVMNNLLPSKLIFHEKYDLKGSTHKRKASQKERLKELPTYKDLDFIQRHPWGLVLEKDVRENLMKTLERDVRVLQSFKIMDYSLLLSIHNVTHFRKTQAGNERVQQTTTMNSKNRNDKETFSEELYAAYLQNGIPAETREGEELILFLGIIDILQNYRLAKKTEHGFKSLFGDGDTISVHNPKYYSSRFISFCNFIFQEAGKEPKQSPYLNLNKNEPLHQVEPFKKEYYRRSSLKPGNKRMNEPRLIQEESCSLKNKLPAENARIDKTTESKTDGVEENQI